MRKSGILMPVSSLPGACGIGSFGKPAYHFVDFLADAGQTIWQILPLSPTGYGDSPYQSCSAFASNPYFIDLDTLVEDGLLTAAEVKKTNHGKLKNAVDYGALYESRYALLHTAHAAFEQRCAVPGGGWPNYPQDFSAFCANNNSWLEDYVLYMAIKTEQRMAPWQEWPEGLRLRREGEVNAFRAVPEHITEMGFWRFVQYECARQWEKLKHYANEQGVKILGDIPIYVSADSVDAWVGGPLFELDAQGSFARVAGCPPDYFSADGQLWGNPLYNWDYHRSTGYAWWIGRVRHALHIYDMLRIDHFRGFDTYWAIPAGSETARTGKWENGPGMELFRALKNALGELPIVAEDLGELFPSVRALLAESGFPGMKVLQFAFGGGDNEYLPHNHIKNCVIYPGTHDNDTLEGWWKTGASAAEKANVTAYFGLEKGAGAPAALLRAALASTADTAIVPMYDWLGLGGEARLNTPGRLGGNWSWRAADGFDSAKLAKAIRTACVTYCRAEPAPQPAAAAPRIVEMTKK